MGTMQRVAERLGMIERSGDPAPTSTPTGQGGAAVPPSRSAALQAVTPDRASEIDAVYRALFVIETGVHQLTVDVWRTLNGVTSRIEPPAFVTQPNIDESGASFYASTCVSLASRGNAYWHKTFSADGLSVLNVDLLDPLSVHVEKQRRTGRLLYHTPLQRDPFTSHEISHLRLLRMPGKHLGLGPIQAAQRNLGAQLQMRDYAASWFDEGSGHTDALLSTTQHLTAEQAKQYKTAWQESQTMGDGPAVLGGGLTYNVLSLKPSELQWLDAQKFGITGIARLFGMPSSLMLAPVDGSSLTYKNQEQEDQAFLRYTLMRYLREIEDAITRILPRTQRARFNVDALLRSDTTTRYDAHKTGLEAGFLSVPEVRAMEGLDPTILPAIPERTPQK